MDLFLTIRVAVSVLHRLELSPTSTYFNALSVNSGLDVYTCYSFENVTE